MCAVGPRGIGFSVDSDRDDATAVADSLNARYMRARSEPDSRLARERDGLFYIRDFYFGAPSELAPD